MQKNLHGFSWEVNKKIAAKGVAAKHLSVWQARLREDKNDSSPRWRFIHQGRGKHLP
ncbi:hypothetical protein [Gallaecimonas pentaromativorans]|uniref:hypothetical protein n=1 Tax=Gallaecimonas pentaromativorans TaxID=584787 RepID=UPI0012ECF257|nr:hypothetical protein [Gallaecimonas pentaromativorans]